MKTEIHPEYTDCRVVCSCGNQFVTRATVTELHVELCAECHPFYTGKQKLVDTGGRVERFQRRYAETGGAPAKKQEQDEEAAPASQGRKRKAPVAAKKPRPKFEQRPGRGDDRREGRERGRRGEGKGEAKGDAKAEGKGDAKAEAPPEESAPSES